MNWSEVGKESCEVYQVTCAIEAKKRSTSSKKYVHCRSATKRYEKIYVMFEGNSTEFCALFDHDGELKSEDDKVDQAIQPCRYKVIK